MTASVEEIQANTISHLENDFKDLVHEQKDIFLRAVDAAAAGNVTQVYLLHERSKDLYAQHASHAFRTLKISDLPIYVQKEIAVNYLTVKEWCEEQYDQALEHSLKVFSK
jgi:hypothetical protein